LKRLYFVAGESSGDMHGAALIRALRAATSEVHCEGLGGRGMQAAGMDLHHDLAGDGIMGFTEVVKHFLPIRRLFLEVVERLRQNPPDALVLIDYPGFNIRLAKAAQRLGIPVIYYISPQIWAWKKKRLYTLARYVSLMLVIFPFEESLYTKVGLPCRYVGHPLIEEIAERGEGEAGDGGEGGMVIGLLPGSRAQEIERLLGPMLETARGIRAQYPEARFMTPVVNERRAALVRSLAGEFPLEVRVEGMHEVLLAARFCLVASGTATLETALYGVPFAIVYRVSPVTFWLAKRIVDIEHIGIVNILAGRRVVPEFIQHDAHAAQLLPVALELITDTPAREQMQNDLRAVREMLGAGGASACAAHEILTFIQEPTCG
jgi:lipid-A-disaccharide synthase